MSNIENNYINIMKSSMGVALICAILAGSVSSYPADNDLNDIMGEITALLSSIGPNDLLINAAESGDLDGVRRFIEKGANINVREKTHNNTALIIASGIGTLEMVKYLVEHGADVNVNGGNGTTALIEAAQKGKLDVAKYLIENGANVHGITDTGVTAVDAALEQGHTEMAKMLKSAGGQAPKELEKYKQLV